MFTNYLKIVVLEMQNSLFLIQKVDVRRYLLGIFELFMILQDLGNTFFWCSVIFRF